MGKLNVYQKLQIGFVLLITGMFTCYWTLDLLRYELSDVANGMFQAIWSIILLLIDPKGLVRMIQTANGVEVPPDAPEPAKAGEGGYITLRFLTVLVAILALVFCLSGCTTLNVSLNTTSGDNNKPNIKATDSDTQTVSPNTTATIPLR